MAIVRRTREGTGPLTRFRGEMDDLFGRFFGDLGEWPLTSPRGGMWWPAIDIAERDDAVVLKVEIPGMKSDEIDISVQGNTLTISGDKKESTEEKEENRYHIERRYGTFRRDILLPSGVDANKVEATYKDGILTVTLPKTEESKPQKITVKT